MWKPLIFSLFLILAGIACLGMECAPATPEDACQQYLADSGIGSYLADEACNPHVFTSAPPVNPD